MAILLYQVAGRSGGNASVSHRYQTSQLGETFILFKCMFSALRSQSFSHSAHRFLHSVTFLREDHEKATMKRSIALE